MGSLAHRLPSRQLKIKKQLILKKLGNLWSPDKTLG